MVMARVLIKFILELIDFQLLIYLSIYLSIDALIDVEFIRSWCTELLIGVLFMQI